MSCSSRIAGILGTLVVLACAPATAIGRPTLGSPALARQSGTIGLGSAAPRSFDAGGFPFYDDLRWTGWGSPSAFAQGYNSPDGGPGSGPRIEVRAFDLGSCDSIHGIYRRIDIRQLGGGKWGRWDPFVPNSARGAPGSVLCLDAVVHHCAVTQGSEREQLVAYNIECDRADRYWLTLPRGWSGANADDTAGGHAVIYPKADAAAVMNATRANGTLTLSGLAGVPVIWQRVDVGE
jgi:hypothetical protein